MNRFCVAFSHHNWIRTDPNQVDRFCSKCKLVEPRRTNRDEAIPRRPGRHTPATTMAVDSLAQAQPCPRSAGGEHEWRTGRGYDFCHHCGLVLRDALSTVAPAEQPVYKVSSLSKLSQLAGLGPARPPTPSPKAMQRRRGKVLVLFARDGNGCFYCGIALDPDDAVLDHFIPRSAGGPDELENRRASCVRCDKAKRDQMPWVFRPSRFSPPDGLA